MTNKTDLYDHQKAAVDKMLRLKVGALFMEMGTGKTRVALEIIKHRLDAGKIDHVLWLCPCSVQENLRQDIDKHSDLRRLPGVLTICGIETLSTSMRTCERLMSEVTTHKTFLIVDESSLVKNPVALRSVHIQEIADKCPYRMILNGTPVTKFEADLFSQWRILDWRILGYRSFYSFAANHLEYDKDRHEKVVRALNVDYLTRKMAPYTYQCRKEDVFTLPKKTEEIYDFCLTPRQEMEYERVIERLLTSLDDMSDAAIYRLFGALQGVVSGFSIRIDDDNSVHRSPMFEEPEQNPRITALLDVIGEIPDGEKILIFCTYVQEVVDVMATIEKKWGDQAVEFTGAVNLRQREQALRSFAGNKRFMIANKNCGAFGLNLQFCRNVVFYSHDWNWGTRAQAEDRVHRLGQENEVKIVDIVASDTIDRQIMRCLQRKERLSDNFKQRIDRQSAIDFLKGGVKNGENLSQAKCVRGNKGTA